MKINNYLHFKEKCDITPDEKKEMQELILKSFNESRLKFYDTVIYFTNENNKIIGFVGLYYIDKYLSINQLCIDEKYRNNGIASLLLELIFYLYHTTSIILYIDKNKESTDYLLEFYMRKGFKNIDYLKTLNLSYDDKIEYLMIREHPLRSS